MSRGMMLVSPIVVRCDGYLFVVYSTLALAGCSALNEDILQPPLSEK